MQINSQHDFDFSATLTVATFQFVQWRVRKIIHDCAACSKQKINGEGLVGCAARSLNNRSAKFIAIVQLVANNIFAIGKLRTLRFQTRHFSAD